MKPQKKNTVTRVPNAPLAVCVVDGCVIVVDLVCLLKLLPTYCKKYAM